MLPLSEESIRIRKIRIEGWAKDILEKNNDDDPDPWLGWAKDILEKKKNDDDDPDPSNSRTDIFRVCAPANANPNQDTSASTTYLGNQAGNTNMVEDILVGRSGAGSWLAWMSTWSPGGVQTHFLVSIPTALSSSQDSSASSTYLGNQAGNTFMVEDLWMGAEWLCDKP